MNTQAGGVTLIKSAVLNLIDMPDNPRWVEETNNAGVAVLSFPPIHNSGDIPFYPAITQLQYQHFSEDDKFWIKEYTGIIKYKRLKAQSYVLNPDEVQLNFLKRLYLAVWAVYQTELPKTVYHICSLTDTSFSWYQPGMEFITPAFVSTSKRDDLKWEGNCKWEITLNPRKRDHVAYVKDWSEFPDEEEILISCCTRFKVLEKYTKHKGKDYYIYLEYLDI